MARSVSDCAEAKADAIVLRHDRVRVATGQVWAAERSFIGSSSDDSPAVERMCRGL